jgi:hypothetical protein
MFSKCTGGGSCRSALFFYMRTDFYIICRLRTATGFEAYGWFNLGNDRDFASAVFAKLQGRDNPQDTDFLHLDLMEARDGLPVNLRVLNCTAEELAANCKCITKEMFKLLNL